MKDNKLTKYLIATKSVITHRKISMIEKLMRYFKNKFKG